MICFDCKSFSFANFFHIALKAQSMFTFKLLVAKFLFYVETKNNTSSLVVMVLLVVVFWKKLSFHCKVIFCYDIASFVTAFSFIFSTRNTINVQWHHMIIGKSFVYNVKYSMLGVFWMYYPSWLTECFDEEVNWSFT